MKIFLKVRKLGTILSLLLLCSCSTVNPNHPQLPADVRMNKDAGRGGVLIVKLHLESGETVPVIVDTGCPVTVFDKSMEGKLGKCLGSFPGRAGFGYEFEAGIYAAPKLYLGNTPLMMTGTNINTLDLAHWPVLKGCPIKGVLGMDVLENYCIQLDFAANKIRFLDDEHADKEQWGKLFPLSDYRGGVSIEGNILGAKSPGSFIDTGCGEDGWLTPELFRQWIDPTRPTTDGLARFPDGVLGGETYSEIDDVDDTEALSRDALPANINGIGLHLLSRHLVTLDFPKKTMYLKRTSIKPLADAKLEATAKSARELLQNLLKQGQLPGWAKNDEMDAKTAHYFYHFSDSITCDHFLKKGDSSAYHFELARTSIENPWKLRKAWRTDESQHTLEEFPVQ
jgi:hypothetical protein